MKLPDFNIQDIIGKRLLGFYAVPLGEHEGLEGQYESEINFFFEKIEEYFIIRPKHSDTDDLESDKELILSWNKEIQNNLVTTYYLKKLKTRKYQLEDFGKVTSWKYSIVNQYSNSDEKALELSIESEVATISIHGLGVIPFINLSVTKKSSR